MELKLLEDVIALLEERNFSKAALRRNVTQPAFSRRIKSFEDWVGTAIVDRTSQPITILECAERMEPEIRTLAKRMKELKPRFLTANHTRRVFEFAAPHTLAVSTFPSIMQLINEKVPDTSVRLRSANIEGCVTMCLSGDADFLLCFESSGQAPKLPDAHFSKVSWGIDRLIPVVGGKLKYELDANQCLPETVNLLTYTENSFLGGVLGMDSLNKLGDKHQINLVCQSAFTPSIREMCLKGLGLAWLPVGLIWRDLRAGSLVSLASELECCELESVVYWRKDDDQVNQIGEFLKLNRATAAD